MTCLPTICVTFDQRLSAFTTAYWIMEKYGVPGTWFVDPATLGTQSGNVLYDNLALMQQYGWEIGCYSGQNMVDKWSNNRDTAKQFLKSLKDQMTAFGFTPHALAPNQRNWNGYLRNLASDIFECVRVCDDTSAFQVLPVTDPLYVRQGGSSSLSSTSTTADLCSYVDRLIAAGPGQMATVVVHDVDGTDPSYSVPSSIFSPFIQYLSTKAVAGNLRVCTFSQAILGRPL